MPDESAGHPSGAALPGTPPLDAREPSPSSAPLPELQALGSLLARARAERAIPASELAQRVCIGEDQLLAVERGDADRLPELVFVVAQARRLAACLGVDAEQEIAALRAAQRSSQSRQAKTQVMAPAPAPRRVSAGPSAKPASRPAALRDAGGPGNRGWLWLLPGVLLASALAVAGFHLLPRLRVPQLSRSAAPSAAPAPSPRSLPTAVRPPAPPVASLLLSSSEPSWLSVRDGAGQSLFEGTFTGERRFPLKGGLSVMAGRPDLVKVSLGDQPSRPLGTIDQVVWHTFAPPASAVSGVPAASSAASSSITNAASGAAAPPGVPPKAPTP